MPKITVSSRTLSAGLLPLCMMLGGCQSPTQRALAYAQAHGLRTSIVQGRDYDHQLFEVVTPDHSKLLVLIEGDGSPWQLGGMHVAPDPTPQRPLMLRILARSRMSALYVGRPCYFAALSTQGCTSDIWTSHRYSDAVVDSLATVINTYASQGGFEQVILAGHSGGGTLAVLAAARVPRTVAVITMSANLDTEAWATFHHYLPLTGSLNPSDEPPLPQRIKQWHAVGDRDRNAPASLSARYWSRLPPELVLHFPKADHACCWEKVWPGILAKALTAVPR